MNSPTLDLQGLVTSFSSSSSSSLLSSSSASAIASLATPAPMTSEFESWRGLSPSTFNGTSIEGAGSDLDYHEFLWQQLVANNVAVAAVTLYCWEYLTSIASELHLYERAYRRTISRVPVILFALVRYGSVPAVILPAYSVWKDFSREPSGCVSHQQLCIVFVQLIVSCVFVRRTAAIWRKERKAVLLLISITIIQFGLSFYFLWFSSEMLLPNGACMPVSSKGYYNTLPWFYLLAFLYDLTLASLSIFKLWSYTDKSAPASLNRRRPSQATTAASAPGIVVIPRQDEKDFGSSHPPSPVAPHGSCSSLQKKANGIARLPVEKVRRAHQRWLSLPPLLTRLFGNGLQYFAVASTFNVVSLALEVSNSIHAKSVIALYAPVMAMTCQRLILLEVKVVWGSSYESGIRERSLVQRALRARESWEGDGGTNFTARSQQLSLRRGSAPALSMPEEWRKRMDTRQRGTGQAENIPPPPPAMTTTTSPTCPPPRETTSDTDGPSDFVSSQESSHTGDGHSQRSLKASERVPEEQRGIALRMAGLQ